MTNIGHKKLSLGKTSEKIKYISSSLFQCQPSFLLSKLITFFKKQCFFKLVHHCTNVKGPLVQGKEYTIRRHQENLRLALTE